MPRIDPPMIRPQAKGEMIIGGPDGFPIRLPAGSEGSILTVHDGSPAWETPEPIYTQSQINALLGPLYHDGEEGQVIRFTGGSAEWSDEIDAYTKGEADALLDERSLVGHTHEIEEISNLALELADRSLLGHTHTAVEVHGIEDYVIGVAWDAVQDLSLEDIDAAPSVHTHPVTDLETTGTADSTTFLRGDGSWSVPPGNVESVNGKTGTVVLTPSDIGAVESVNGKTGTVVLTPSDVGAAPVGHQHEGTGPNTTALGGSASASGESATAVGSGADASTWYATAVGANADASGFYSTAVGSGASVSGLYSTAVGPGASTSDGYAIALGFLAVADTPGTMVASAHTLVMEPRNSSGVPSQAPSSIQMYNAANEKVSISVDGSNNLVVTPV